MKSLDSVFLRAPVVPPFETSVTLWQRHCGTAGGTAVPSIQNFSGSFHSDRVIHMQCVWSDVTCLCCVIRSFKRLKKKQRYFGYLSFRRDFNLLQLRCFCRVLSDFQAVLTFSFSRCFHKNQNKNKAYLFKLPCPGWEVFCGLFSGCPDVLRYRVPESRGLQVQPLLFLRSSAADP